MIDKIKWGAAIALIVIIGVGLLYIKSLKADNDRISAELVLSKGMVAAHAANLVSMKEAGNINTEAQTKARQTINDMNKELTAARRQPAQRQGVTNEAETNNPVAGLVADQLNRLFNPAANGSQADPADIAGLSGTARHYLAGARRPGGSVGG